VACRRSDNVSLYYGRRPEKAYYMHCILLRQSAVLYRRTSILYEERLVGELQPELPEAAVVVRGCA